MNLPESPASDRPTFTDDQRALLHEVGIPPYSLTQLRGVDVHPFLVAGRAWVNVQAGWLLFIKAEIPSIGQFLTHAGLERAAVLECKHRGLSIYRVPPALLAKVGQ